MVLNALDKSNYLKGMLVLMKKRYTIEETIDRTVKYMTELLDFNQAIIDESIKALMTNNSIADDPPTFSDFQIAESFLKDGIHVVFLDGTLNFKQIDWLINTAKINNFSEQWIFIELEEYYYKHELNENTSFEIQKFLN
jgi:hypothetical protein